MPRDLKSLNVLLLDARGQAARARAKLADFGFCKIKNSADSKARTVAGMPLWNAPELMSQEPHDAQAARRLLARHGAVRAGRAADAVRGAVADAADAGAAAGRTSAAGPLRSGRVAGAGRGVLGAGSRAASHVGNRGGACSCVGAAEESADGCRRRRCFGARIRRCRRCTGSFRCRLERPQIRCRPFLPGPWQHRKACVFLLP